MDIFTEEEKAKIREKSFALGVSTKTYMRALAKLKGSGLIGFEMEELMTALEKLAKAGKMASKAGRKLGIKFNRKAGQGKNKRNDTL